MRWDQDGVLLFLGFDLVAGEEVLAFAALGINVVDVDSGEYFVEAGAILGVDNHLVGIKVQEDLVVVSPDLGCKLEEFVKVFDVGAL